MSSRRYFWTVSHHFSKFWMRLAPQHLPARPPTQKFSSTLRLGLHKGHMFFLSLTGCPHSIYFEEDSSMDAWRQKGSGWRLPGIGPNQLVCKLISKCHVGKLFLGIPHVKTPWKIGRRTLELCNEWRVEQTRMGRISLERWDKLHKIHRNRWICMIQHIFAAVEPFSLAFSGTRWCDPNYSKKYSLIDVNYLELWNRCKMYTPPYM